MVWAYMYHSVTFHVCPRSGSPTMLDYDPGTKNQPAPPGSLGGTGKKNTPDSRALTFRIFAPDRGPQGWGNKGVIVM